MKDIKLPKSCTSLVGSIASLICLLVFLFLLKHFEVKFSFWTLIGVLFSIVVPISLYDLFILKVYNRSSTGLDLGMAFQFNSQRVLTKCIGLIGTLFCIALCYWVFPEYHGSFYQGWWSYLKHFGIIFAIAAIPYIAFVDSKMKEPEDSLYHSGLFFLGKFSNVNKSFLKAHALSWLIKAFFLPLMVVYSIGNLNSFLTTDWIPLSSVQLYHKMHNLIYLIDLVFVIVGYSFSLRVLDSHVRSSESTALGWIVALFCYQPFWGSFEKLYIQYEDSKNWLYWISESSPLFYVWGIIIVILIGIYAFSSVCFGVRFSNLTHRGIITNGPYAFTKHPAYVCKNISWWLISLPFLFNSNGSLAIRQCLMLLLLNFVYYLRAKTEEKHLSQDPVYVEYALAMNEKSIFKFASKLIPALRFKG